MPEVGVRAVAPGLAAASAPSSPRHLDLTEVVRGGVAGRAHHDVDVEFGAVLGDQRAGPQRPRAGWTPPRRAAASAPAGSPRRTPVACSRADGSGVSLRAQLVVGHRRSRACVSAMRLELLGLVAAVLDHRDVGLAAQPQPGPVELLGERDVGEHPLLAVGVLAGPASAGSTSATAASSRPSRPPSPLPEPVATQSIRCPAPRPARRRRSTEWSHRAVCITVPVNGSSSTQVGHHRLGEQPDGRHHDVEGVLVAGRRWSAATFAVSASHRADDDLGVQRQVRPEPVALARSVRSRPGSPACPDHSRDQCGVQVERERVQVRLHVAGQTRDRC